MKKMKIFNDEYEVDHWVRLNVDNKQIVDYQLCVDNGKMYILVVYDDCDD